MLVKIDCKKLLKCATIVLHKDKVCLYRFAFDIRTKKQLLIRTREETKEDKRKNNKTRKKK